MHTVTPKMAAEMYCENKEKQMNVETKLTEEAVSKMTPEQLDELVKRQAQVQADQGAFVQEERKID